MKAVRLRAYGERPLVEEVAEPELAGPSDVIVRVSGAGLCRTDLHIIEGLMKEKSGVTLPYTLGHENAGRIEAIGPAVDHLAVGDPVILHPLITCGLCAACRAGDDMHCERSAFPGFDTDGGFAELVRTGARSVVRLAPGVAPENVAALADAGLTAYHAVKKALPLLHVGATAVVLGAGGLGHIGIQVLKALTPVTVIVVERSEGAADLARTFGADYVLITDGSQRARVREITSGAGCQVVFDFVGEGGAVEDGVAMLSRRGTYYVIGYDGVLALPTVDIIAAELSFVGNLVGTHNELAELMDLEAKGLVTLHTQQYPLAAFNDAIDALENGRLQGRAILIP